MSTSIFANPIQRRFGQAELHGRVKIITSIFRVRLPGSGKSSIGIDSCSLSKSSACGHIPLSQANFMPRKQGLGAPDLVPTKPRDSIPGSQTALYL
jgi:hypothetical protein